MVLAIVRFVILGGLLVVGLAVLYRYAPDRDQPKWSWVSWGRGSPPCVGAGHGRVRDLRQLLR